MLHLLISYHWIQAFVTNPFVLVLYCGRPDYHKLGGLNVANLLFHGSAGQKSDIGLTVLKLRCWQIYGPAGGSQGRSVSLPFAFSRGCSHSLPRGSFLHLHSLHWQAGSLLTRRHPGRWHVHVTFSGSCPLLPSFTSKDPRDSIGSTG